MDDAAHNQRIAFVTTDLDTGGAEVFLVDLLQALKGQGATVMVISLKTLGSQGQRLLDAGIAVSELRISGPLGFVVSAVEIRKRVRLFGATLVQGWMYHGNIAATRACHALDLPIYWSVHNSLQNLQGESWSVRGAIAWSRRLSVIPDAVHYCSRVAAGQHRAYGFSERRQWIIPNGFNCQRFKPCPEQIPAAKEALGFTRGTPVIGHIGRYNPMKDHQNFIAAAARLHVLRPDVGFALMGRDVDENNTALVAQRRRQGLAGSMRLLGEQEQMPRLIHGLDVLSTSSRAEAFPIVLGEAMAAGIPCVATDVGDCAYLLGDAGLLAPPKAPDSLAAAWLALLTETQAQRQARSRCGRQRILQTFSLEAVAGQFLAMYRNKG